MVKQRRRNEIVRGFLLASTFAFSSVGCASGAPSPENGEDDLGSTQQAVCDGTTKGHWSLFPAGDGVSSTNQCVHGVSVFYTAKFGVPRLAASYSKTVGNCLGYGACQMWLSSHPNPALWNRYAWGTETPQTYDLVIYPPSGSAAGYGHVASVDHYKGGVLYVMDMNWNAPPEGYRYRKSTCAHTVSRTPYGFYRLKSLEPPKTPPKPTTDAGTDAGADTGKHDADVDAASDALVDAHEANDSASEADTGEPPVEVDSGDLEAGEAGPEGDLQGGTCSVEDVGGDSGSHVAWIALAAAAVLISRRRRSSLVRRET